MPRKKLTDLQPADRAFFPGWGTLREVGEVVVQPDGDSVLVSHYSPRGDLGQTVGHQGQEVEMAPSVGQSRR